LRVAGQSHLFLADVPSDDRHGPLTFGVAGVLQTYIERVMGLGVMTAQPQTRFWFAVTWVLGLILLKGVIVIVVDLLTLKATPPAREQT